MKRWYVVHTRPRMEDRAREHLMQQDYSVYLPRYLKRRSHARRVMWIRAPMFPRYLFVSLDLKTDAWRSIYSTMGVMCLVGQPDAPMPTPSGIIEGIRQREDEHGLIKLLPSFKRGDPVTLCQGAFAAQQGIFECRTDEERVVVLMELMGRQLRVQVSLDAISSAA